MTAKYLYSLWNEETLEYIFDNFETAFSESQRLRLTLKRLRILDDGSVRIMNL
jgi:hypothetical protein